MDVSRYIANRAITSFSKSFTRRIIQISVGAISLSLAVMLIAQSVFKGFQDDISEKIFGFWGHIHITDINVNRSIEPIPIIVSPYLLDSIQNLTGYSKNVDNKVSHVQGFVILPGIISMQGQYDGLFFKGVNKDFRASFFERFLVRGTPIQYESTDISRDLLLSHQTANRLKVDTGQSVIANFVIEGQHIKRKLNIRGIYKTGLEEYDRIFCLVDQRLLQQVLSWDSNQITGLEVFVENVNKVEEVNEVLYNDILPTRFYAESIRSKFPNIFEWLSLQDINKQFILSLVLAVCIINMATTLLILILERIHLIGILISLGMNFRSIRRIFLQFGVYILLRGMVIGNVVGLSICLIQKYFKPIKLSEADYYLDHAPVSLNIWPIIIINMIFFVVVLGFLILPSYFIKKIKPIQALRFN
ncbi:MAG: FtsX-like permease family protein [Bacteroidota bacterium]|nr:FtsX-like permease family protein [Bacteroidota bacterium]